jgi:hypothetical protein
MNLTFSRNVFEKCSYTKFHENQSIGSRVDSHTRRDITKLRVPFCNFANVARKDKRCVGCKVIAPRILIFDTTWGKWFVLLGLPTKASYPRDRLSLSDTSRCVPISWRSYLVHRHAQHNQQFSRFLLSAYIQAIIRTVHYLERMENKHKKVYILTRKRHPFPFTQK